MTLKFRVPRPAIMTPWMNGADRPWMGMGRPLELRHVQRIGSAARKSRMRMVGIAVCVLMDMVSLNPCLCSRLCGSHGCWSVLVGVGEGARTLADSDSILESAPCQ